MNRSSMRFALLASLASTMVAPASAQQQKPNILVIMGDDIGYWNISAYNRGMMGTAPPTSTALRTKARSSQTTTGSNPAPPGAPRSSPDKVLWDGLLKVGLPAAKEGLSAKDPTIAELLKPQGYATGQFGKNISAIATNSYPPCTASTNSSATFIT